MSFASQIESLARTTSYRQVVSTQAGGLDATATAAALAKEAEYNRSVALKMGGGALRALCGLQVEPYTDPNGVTKDAYRPDIDGNRAVIVLGGTVGFVGQSVISAYNEILAGLVKVTHE